MKTNILTFAFMSIAIGSTSIASENTVVAKCSILSDKNGNGEFNTKLGSFQIIRYESTDPELSGYEEGGLQVDAFDGGYQNYAKKNTSVEFRIGKIPNEDFYSIEAWGMTRNRSAEANVTLKTKGLPLSVDIRLASSENETKSAQLATAQQSLGTVRLTCDSKK